MRELKLYQRDERTGKITFGMGPVAKFVEGIDRLIQIVIFAIIENPGRDVMNPTDGSGIRALIGLTNISDEQELVADLTLGITKIQQEIVDKQSTTNDDPSEKLQTIQIIHVAADADTASASLTLRVVNQAGDSKFIVL